MQKTETLIIGAGQCGLAMSLELSRRGREHLVLDAGRAGESWHSKRWNSLRLLTPNWMNALGDEAYGGHDAHGFMTASEFAAGFDGFVSRNGLPVVEGASVTSLTRNGAGFLAETAVGSFTCQNVVIATGACARPKIPAFASDLPASANQISPIEYRAPESLGRGPVLVVGASASGLQLAREIALSGRRVTLSVGSHSRLPRRYRGRDILDWMHRIGVFDETFESVDDLERVRRTPSLPLIGSQGNISVDLNALQALGVEIVGRTMGVRDGTLMFSGSLANVCAAADLKMNRLLDRIDAACMDEKPKAMGGAPMRPEATRCPSDPRLTQSVEDFGTIVWATGFSPDHSFVRIPVFDRKGRIVHEGGVVEQGLYVLGLPFLRSFRSVHIDGAMRDARALAHHLCNSEAPAWAA